MISSKITKRYAKSLIELSIERGQLTDSYNDLVLVNKVCSENSDFILMLKSPIIATDKKLAIIKSIFSNQLSQLTLLFIEIIAISESAENATTAEDASYARPYGLDSSSAAPIAKIS